MSLPDLRKNLGTVSGTSNSLRSNKSDCLSFDTRNLTILFSRFQTSIVVGVCLLCRVHWLSTSAHRRSSAENPYLERRVTFAVKITQHFAWPKNDFTVTSLPSFKSLRVFWVCLRSLRSFPYRWRVLSCVSTFPCHLEIVSNALAEVPDTEVWLSTFLGTFRPHLAANLARDSPASGVKSWIVKSMQRQARVETMMDDWWASNLKKPSRVSTRFTLVNVGNSHNSMPTRVFFKFCFKIFNFAYTIKLPMDIKRKLLSCPDSVIWDSEMSLHSSFLTLLLLSCVKNAK